MKVSVRYPLNGAVFGPVLMVSLYRLKTWSYRWNHYYRFEYFWLQHKTTPFVFLPLFPSSFLRWSWTTPSSSVSPNRRTTPLIPLRFIFSAPKTTPFIRPRHSLFIFPFFSSISLTFPFKFDCFDPFLLLFCPFLWIP